jgi:hypothetical protein
MASASTVKIDWSQVDNPELIFQKFSSRRSVVYGTKGVVSSSQPLATEAGLEVLRKGGNAGMDTHFHMQCHLAATRWGIDNDVQRMQQSQLPRR